MKNKKTRQFFQIYKTRVNNAFVGHLSRGPHTVFDRTQFIQLSRQRIKG